MKDKRKLMIGGIIISLSVAVIFTVISIVAFINGKSTTRTIMIYMVGSNLESQGGLATEDLNSISKNIQSNNKVLLIAGGSTKWENTYISSDETSIYELTNNGFEKVKKQLKQNMGNKDTFSAFLKFAYNYSKTDEYDLVFWNHGGAIDGSEYDELSGGDNLTLKEMSEALSESPFNSKKLELVIFRTCLNGTVEVNSVFSKYAKLLVASEEVTLGMKGTGVLNFINDIKPNDKGKDVGKKFIDSYKKQISDLKEYIGSIADDSIYSTYSLVNLSNIEDLKKELNEFFVDVDLKTDYNTVSKVRANLYQYAGEDDKSYDMVDLYNLIYNLRDLSPKKADKILKRLDKTIIYNYATDSKSRGMSIYFPYNGSNLAKEKFINVYDDIEGFNNYKNFIMSFYKMQTGSYKVYNYSNNSLNSKKSSEKDAYADFELELTDEQLETFAKAKYYVYKDLGTGYYKSVYNGLNAELDGNILKASIKDRQLQVVGKNNEVYDLTATEIENTDKYIKYSTIVLLQTFSGNISEWKNDKATMTLYYDKETKKINIASVIYDSKNSNINSIALNINDYDNVIFSISSGWTILDEKGNYTGPIIENGSVKGDGIITGFEDKPGNFKFQLSNFSEKANYYCVFAITDTHNNVSYSKLIKLK